jgi:hypothetical protein
MIGLAQLSTGCAAPRGGYHTCSACVVAARLVERLVTILLMYKAAVTRALGGNVCIAVQLPGACFAPACWCSSITDIIYSQDSCCVVTCAVQ